MSAQLEDLPIPMELLLIIFQHLPVKSMKNCLAVSRYGFYYIKFLREAFKNKNNETYGIFHMLVYFFIV